jgi:hypothetical protein
MEILVLSVLSRCRLATSSQLTTTHGRSYLMTATVSQLLLTVNVQVRRLVG